MEQHSNHLRFYRFMSKGYLSSFAVSPDLFEKALKENDCKAGGPREIQRLLREGDYPDWVQFPIVFHQIDGTKLRDIIDSRRVDFDVISERVESILCKHNITGWKTYPVRIFDKKENEIFGYRGFSVLGRGGRLIYLKDGPEVNFRFEKKDKILDLTEWDGSDIFLVFGVGIIISDRAMKLFKENRVSAVDYLPINDVYTVIYPSEL